MKRVGKSSPLLQYVTFSAVFHNIQEMKSCFPACDRKPDFIQLDRRAHIYTVKMWLLSLCSYVCLHWPEIFCVKGLVLSAHKYVMVFQDQHTLPKWNILSLLVYKQVNRQNISLCEGVLVLEDHYIHMSRENKAFDTEYFWPIQWISCHLIYQEDHVWSSLQN